MGHLDSPITLVQLLWAVLSSAYSCYFRVSPDGTTGLLHKLHANDGARSDSFRRAISVAIILGLLTIMLIPVIIFLAGMTLTMSDDVSNGMSRYLAIVCLSAPAITINMVIIGVLFGLQRIRATVIQLMTVNTINIIGNIILVYGVGMRLKAWPSDSNFPLLWIACHLAHGGFGDQEHYPVFFLPFNIILNISAMRRYLGLGFDLTIRTSCIILSELIV